MDTTTRDALAIGACGTCGQLAMLADDQDTGAPCAPCRDVERELLEAARATVELVPDDYYPLVYPLPAGWTGGDLFADQGAVLATLRSMGVTVEDGSSPLAAWRDAVADASGVDRATLDPGQGGVLDLGFSPAIVRRFVWWIA